MTINEFAADEVSHLNTSHHSLTTSTHTLTSPAPSTRTPSPINNNYNNNNKNDTDIYNNNNNNNNNNSTEKTTAEHIDNISRLGTSGISIVRQLEEMEKCMDYLQQQLQENTGCINELDFNFPTQKQATGTACNNELDNFWVDNGSGLLPFIQKCLRNETRYCSIIKWINKNDKEFKIVDPEKLAMMWGLEKRKEGMTKRKLTRSLAYLVNVKKRLKRSSTRTFVYQIVVTSERRPYDDLSSSDSNLSSPIKYEMEAPAELQNNVTTLNNKQNNIPVEGLKRILRENPQYIKIFMDVQKKQQQIQQQKQTQVAFQMAGTKRSYNENALFDTLNYNTNNNNNNTEAIDTIFSNFNNSKIPKYSTAQSNYNGSNVCYNTQTMPNQLPWSQILDQSDYYASCSPVSSTNASDCNDNTFSMTGSPLSTLSEGSAGFFQVNDSAQFYEPLQRSNHLPTLRALQNNSLTNQLPGNYLSHDANNLSSINPTLCLTEPTNTLTDLSLYL